MSYDGPKAITTTYNGYRFRSRLEARWAVFFDALGIKYDYEKEGFDLGDGVLYLPDFFWTELNCWVEIKPDKIAQESADWKKARKLATASHKNVFVICGSIPFRLDDPTEVLMFSWNMDWADPPEEPQRANWEECPVCHRFQLITEYDMLGFQCQCLFRLYQDHTYERIKKAQLRARQARFEFGESG